MQSLEAFLAGRSEAEDHGALLAARRQQGWLDRNQLLDLHAEECVNERLHRAFLSLPL